MQDLIDGYKGLQDFSGLAFCGGFSYADVLGSAKGWAATIRSNPALLQQFEAFRDDPRKFTLGVCNGAQLLTLLGFVPTPQGQPRFISNNSGRFESRYAAVRIVPSAASNTFFKGMEGSVLGIWVANGEGRASLPVPVDSPNVPLLYVDDDANATEAYPFNPNGSPGGISAYCSADGRHLAMMPHPERCFLRFQQPWVPPAMDKQWEHTDFAPWLRLFQNIRAWAEASQ